VAKGFVNLNRFKHGRAIKRNSKQKADLQSKKKSGDGKLNFVARIDELTFGSILVEDKKHRRNVLIFADGTVNKRKAGYGKESNLIGSAIL
jgi:hypothetical protein